ncbi:MAG: hypothetical protein RL462_722 [Pseudomonadota bacterium]|jgi:uncharacterized membrane protein YgdD (TMEM256/DUF423 family)
MEHTLSKSLRWPSGFIALGAFLAAFSVIASAYAAHAQSLNGSSAGMVQSALQLLQFHALGLILVGVLANFRPQEKRLLVAGVLFVLGSLLFSVNILLRAWHDVQTFRALVPWGGTSFILGWLALGLAYVRKLKPQQASE